MNLKSPNKETESSSPVVLHGIEVQYGIYSKIEQKLNDSFDKIVLFNIKGVKFKYVRHFLDWSHL